MTNEQLITKFDPKNGANLTAEDLETLRSLSDAQIDVLADAYPNQPTRRSYLRLYDTKVPENKQLFQLSTWQNLRNVRKFSNMRNLVPYDFNNTQARVVKMPIAAGAKTSSPKKQVVDLTAQEAADELKNIVAKKAAAKAPAEKSAKKGGDKVIKSAIPAEKKAAKLPADGTNDAEKFDDGTTL